MAVVINKTRFPKKLYLYTQVRKKTVANRRRIREIL